MSLPDLRGPERLRADLMVALRSMRKPVADRVFFLHLPKAGGTSIIRALRLAMGPRHLLRPTTQFMLSVTAADEMAATAGLSRREARDVLLQYALADERARFVGGHFWFHEAIFAPRVKPWQALTLLRDPVELWFSNYFFNLSSDREHHRITQTIAEFADSDRGALLGVDQVRRLLPAESGMDPRSEEAVDAAVSNLRRFALVGVLEELDRFADSYADRFGLRPSFGQRNAGETREHAPVSDDVRAQVAELCAPSRRLYDEARSLA